MKMLRPLRPFHKTWQLRARSPRIHCHISTVPFLSVPDLDLASEPNHLRIVHHTLQSSGILHIQLALPDKDSRYIQNLVLGLHRQHAHGLPITHSADRGWMWDIRPSPESFQSNNTQARSETMEEFPWHTDCSYEESPPRFFALQVLQPDQCGGGTLSILSVDELLPLLPPSARQTLSSPSFRIRVPPEFVKDQGKTSIVGSLLATSTDGKSTKLRFREDIVTPLSDKAAEALAELKSVLLSSAVKARVLDLTAQKLSRGAIVLMDNGRWLHARNVVKDPNRHLRRVRWDACQFSPSQTAHAGFRFDKAARFGGL